MTDNLVETLFGSYEPDPETGLPKLWPDHVWEVRDSSDLYVRLAIVKVEQEQYVTLFQRVRTRQVNTEVASHPIPKYEVNPKKIQETAKYILGEYMPNYDPVVGPIKPEEYFGIYPPKKLHIGVEEEGTSE